MRRVSGLLTLLLTLVLVLPAFAQDDGFIFESQREGVDESIIRIAAQPLLDQGAIVAIYLINGGGAEDFDERLLIK